MSASASSNSPCDSKSGPSPDVADIGSMQETLDQLITSLQLQQATIQDQRDMQLQQQHALIQVSSTLAGLSAQIQALQSQPGGPGHLVSAAAAPPPLPLTSALAGLAPPPLYDGNPKKCRGFITQCRLILRLQAAHLPDDETAVAYIITRLTGRALEWVTPLVERRDPVCLSVPAFLDRLQTVFQGETGRRAASLRYRTILKPAVFRFSSAPVLPKDPELTPRCVAARPLLPHSSPARRPRSSCPARPASSTGTTAYPHAESMSATTSSNSPCDSN
uniref:DUF4939 domain-containing protein n=1 Tax=Denticeps clupeoides TaxID=299321 RepID=A0AAY4CWA6_9TELE